jgi:hypothetical protein
MVRHFGRHGKNVPLLQEEDNRGTGDRSHIIQQLYTNTCHSFRQPRNPFPRAKQLLFVLTGMDSLSINIYLFRFSY